MLLLDLFVSQNKLTDIEAKEIDADASLHDEFLVDDFLLKKHITNDEVTEVRSILHGIPIYTKEVVENKELTSFISIVQSKQLLVVPLEMKDGVLFIGVVDPERANVLDSLQFLFGSTHQAYKVYLITYEAYKRHFGIKDGEAIAEKEVSVTTQVDQADISYIAKEDVDKESDEISDEDLDLDNTTATLDKNLAKLPIPEIFSVILRYAIDNNASDIHIEHVGLNVRIRVRMDGRLEEIAALPNKMHPMVIARVKILCAMKLDEKRKPQDGRFSTKFGDRKIDYRVSSFPGYYGEKIVIRILDSIRGVRKLDDLGFSELQMKHVRNALGAPYGMVLISGPTGSGKTTTLYSMLNELDRDHKNVVSLEDPVEYNIGGMNQSQVFPDIGYTFASGLRSILRQDPDIIMVGEIRDGETAGLAIQAALTGHLVFSTIHTNTSVGVVTRLLDMGVEHYLIAPVLIAALGQRLSRQIAEGCGVPMEMTPALKELVTRQFEDMPEEFRVKMDLTRPLYEAKGNAQFPSGMKGRLPVFEVLNITDDIEEAILRSKGEEEIWKIARKDGMVTIKEDAMMKCFAGKIPFIELAEL
ncbi:MAG: type II/IV secretion system protein [Candidatus Pacebacteria bacterium]|nr:type II/IV secretion system protein [Candidatus Paceibacterota bacterium]MBP9867071.1 type II/IV secretion system protein [Candidatus Paceibacterota bacterium]